MRNISNFIKEALAPNYFISKCVLCDMECSDYMLVSNSVMCLSKGQVQKLEEMVAHAQVDELYVIWVNSEGLAPEQYTIGSLIELSSGNVAIATEMPNALPDNEVSGDMSQSFINKNFYLTTDFMDYTKGYIDINNLENIKLVKKGQI